MGFVAARLTGADRRQVAVGARTIGHRGCSYSRSHEGVQHALRRAHARARCRRGVLQNGVPGVAC
jgi:hypothetical protein